jgi:hypothetical protein
MGGELMSTDWSGHPPSDLAADVRSLLRNPPAAWPPHPVVHPETARALAEYKERAKMSEEGTGRWAGFSDEELDQLLYGLIEAESEDPNPGTNPLRASLRDEINTVVKRRQIEKTSYRGPGRYRRVGGVVYEVLGVVGTTDALVLRDSAIDPEILFIEQREDFETSEVFGARRYEYLGPLASAATAPAEVKVVDAGQGWAKVQTIDGRHYVINVGDSITVPTIVIS